MPVRQGAGPVAAVARPRKEPAGPWETHPVPQRARRYPNLGGKERAGCSSARFPASAAPCSGGCSKIRLSHKDGQSVLKIYLQSCVQHEGITFRIHIFIHI